MLLDISLPSRREAGTTQQKATARGGSLSDDEKGVSCQPTTGYTRLSSVSTSHVQTVQPQHHQYTDRRSTNKLFERKLTRRYLL